MIRVSNYKYKTHLPSEKTDKSMYLLDEIFTEIIKILELIYLRSLKNSLALNFKYGRRD